MRNNYIQPLLLLAVLFLFFQNQTTAQGRFKLGVGGSLISNEGDKENFNTFVAPSLYLAYSIVRLQNFSVSVENMSSFRSTEDEFLRATRNGSATAFPITMEYRLSRLGVYAGAGPAYVKQRLVAEGGSTIDKVGGFYGDITGGLGLRLKKSANAAINLRFHYLKSLSAKREDGGMLSLYLAFGSNK